MLGFGWSVVAARIIGGGVALGSAYSRLSGPISTAALVILAVAAVAAFVLLRRRRRRSRRRSTMRG